MAMLEINDLEVFYGVIRAIKGISFEVNQGEVIALIGANGAGKTTVLHTISGLIKPKNGTITFEGENIIKRLAYDAGFLAVIYGEIDGNNNVISGKYKLCYGWI